MKFSLLQGSHNHSQETEKNSEKCKTMHFDKIAVFLTLVYWC